MIKEMKVKNDDYNDNDDECLVEIKNLNRFARGGGDECKFKN